MREWLETLRIQLARADAVSLSPLSGRSPTSWQVIVLHLLVDTAQIILHPMALSSVDLAYVTFSQNRRICSASPVYRAATRCEAGIVIEVQASKVGATRSPRKPVTGDVQKRCDLNTQTLCGFVLFY